MTNITRDFEESDGGGDRDYGSPTDALSATAEEGSGNKFNSHEKVFNFHEI